MEKIILTLIFALTFTISNANKKEIIADVIFENLTGKELKSGEFHIIEPNDIIKIIKINSLENFKIKLPKKGKYKFSFVADEFMSYTLYPSRITKRNNTITIRLMEKNI